MMRWLSSADGVDVRGLVGEIMKEERREGIRLTTMTEEEAEHFITSMQSLQDSAGNIIGRRYYLADGRLLAVSRLVTTNSDEAEELGYVTVRKQVRIRYCETLPSQPPAGYVFPEVLKHWNSRSRASSAATVRNDRPDHPTD